nr:hypothetical protein [Tanacetum cinerariifolium]
MDMIINQQVSLDEALHPHGMYHKKNVDFAYLLWEDFVYQVEHKDAKKSNEMYYPRFTKVIINFFTTKDPSIPRRNKFGAMLPVELTNEDNKNSTAYKEYYAIASDEGTGIIPGVPDVPTYESDEEISWKSSDEDDDVDDQRDPHAHTFLQHNSMHQSCGSSVVGLFSCHQVIDNEFEV